LSALSVIVFRGPISIGALAAAEQVKPPTISRVVVELERRGLVQRESDPGDARVQLLRATDAGARVLAEGRARRVERLAAAIRELPEADRVVLERASELLERLARGDVS
jgi:DNA-binding MarR family transcriptional regulator